jgi:ectoine hydroxylase-related dioxygenase (phytanoyl-CoA dioxygenase family)
MAAEMSDREKYLYDIQGYLVVPSFLTEEEVDRLNAAFDANRHRMTEDRNSNTGGSPTLAGNKRGYFDGMLTWEKPWCEPFRDLLVHPKIIPYLNTLHGRGWRMDHSPFALFMQKGDEGLILHGPGHNYFGLAAYHYKNGQMRTGMVVFQYQLADVNEGDGGFCCIPGSHKSNYPMPDRLRLWQEDQELVKNIPVKKGDLLIFDEATTHGTMPWTADHERRSLLYRYSPHYLHYAGGYHETSYPDWVEELTEAQRAVLEPPYHYNWPPAGPPRLGGPPAAASDA